MAKTGAYEAAEVQNQKTREAYLDEKGKFDKQWLPGKSADFVAAEAAYTKALAESDEVWNAEHPYQAAAGYVISGQALSDACVSMVGGLIDFFSSSHTGEQE